MQEGFDAAFAALNDKQKQAVRTIDGPVLVVAGPGTGKTQLLSMRVAQILKETDTDPSSILCLTFTNAAALNMRERLQQFIGPSAHKVVIRTFHSFAAEIMNIYPEYFWNGARLTLAPDALQAGIIQTILSELPLDDPLAMKFAGKFTALKDVQDALKLAKEAGLTPDDLGAMLEVNQAYIDEIEPQLVEILDQRLSFKNLDQLASKIAELPEQGISNTILYLNPLSQVIQDSLAQAILADQPTGKTTNTGNWKKRWIQGRQGNKGMYDERDRLAWWQSLVRVYEDYRTKLHARGYYDYSDMIIEVITQLEQHADLLARVQERFLYVLIDEFQDTNKAQLRLADLVARHESTEGRPNLMAVGDDDQSIFAFNGAELNNMLSFRRAYEDTEIILLEDNYRSSQAILDAAAAVIDQADDRLVKREPGLTKQLHARREPATTSIQHLSYPTREHELSGLAHQIQQQWQQDQDADIAILAGGHEVLMQLSSLLTALNVPVKYERRRNIFDSEIVQLILLLAETVIAVGEGDQKATNHHLAKLLQHPVWGIEPLTLWKLAVRQRRQADWLEAIIEHSDETLTNLGHWLLWLAGEASYQPLPIMLEYLIGLRAGSHLTSPIREYYLATRSINSQYLQTLSAAQLLLGLSTEFAEQPTATLYDLVGFAKLNRDLDQSVSDSSWFVSGEHAVELMTVYKSKGLEFDHVYILDAIESKWQPRRGGRKPPANLALQPYGEIYDDYVRLMYVAITRAKQSVTIASYRTDERGGEVLASPLVADIPTTAIDDQGEPIELLEQSLRWPELDGATELQLLKPILDEYSLSATGLLHFLDVTSGGPQQFLETDLLHIPSLSTPSMGYGNAIHRALQFAQMTKPTPDLPTIVGAFKASLRDQHMTEIDFDRYEAHGESILNALFVDKAFTLPPEGQAEVAIYDLQLGEAKLGGKIDHLDPSNNRLLITDYKTGKPLKSFATQDKNLVVKAWKHKTQLTFYALLCQLSGRITNLDDLQTRMLYVEADTAHGMSLNYTPTQADLDRLSALMQAVWTRITTLNLPDITNYSQDIDGIHNFEDDLINNCI